MVFGLFIAVFILLVIVAVLNERLNAQRQMYLSLKSRIKSLEERYAYNGDDLK